MVFYYSVIFDHVNISVLFIAYLVKLEDIRDMVLHGLYEIPACTIPPIDTIADATFEYSILANVLLVIIIILKLPLVC